MNKFTAKFIDGPMQGQIREVMRTTIMLRIAGSGASGRILGEADDLREGETPTAHILAYPPICGFWDGRDKSGRRTGGHMYFGSYRMLEPQPALIWMRTQQVWADWCDANKDSLMEQYESRGALRIDAGTSKGPE